MTSLLASNLNDFGGGIGGTKKRKQVVVLLFYSQHYDEPDLKMRCSPLLFYGVSLGVFMCYFAFTTSLTTASLTSPVQTKAQFRICNLTILISSSV